MKRILGIDLGTTSIGWAYVLEAEAANEQSEIVRLGVRVVPLSVDEETNFEKGKSITTNADRAARKSMRRNIDRYQMRRDELIAVMREEGWITEETTLSEHGTRSTFESLRLRAEAVEKEVTLAQLARILLQINKKRGYKSNRKADSQEEGSVIDGMDVSKQLCERSMTPGQWVYERMQRGKMTVPAFFRSDLQQELDHIWTLQYACHSAWMTDELRVALTQADSRRAQQLMDAHGVIPETVKGKERRQILYGWRSAAAMGGLPAAQLAAVLIQIVRDINASSGYLGQIGDRSKELYFRHETVGQYMWRHIQANPHESLKTLVFYRKDYQNEFDALWASQTRFHPELTERLRKRLRHILFFQRPLKSKKGLVNRCELVHYSIPENAADGEGRRRDVGPKVCPKSSPLFQEFRMWQVLNNLMLIHVPTQEVRPLADEEKEMLAAELCYRVRMKKNDVLKLLCDHWREWDLNYKELEGNRMLAAFYKVYEQVIAQTGHGEYDFEKMRAAKVRELVGGVFGGLGFEMGLLSFDAELDGLAYEQQPLYRLWHLLYSYEGDSSATGDKCLLKRLCALTKMDEDVARLFLTVHFEDDYGSLSTKAMRRILPFLKKGYMYDVACEQAGYCHSVRSRTREELDKRTYKDRLDLLPSKSLHNPVVEKILNQMIHVVNGVTSAYGKPDEIRIEMARELKSCAAERERRTASIAKATKKNAEIEKILRQEFGLSYVSRNDIVRYKLYEELKENDYKTLYSNTDIPKEELFSKAFDIEHIIPQARLFDDSFSNKTLEARQVNIEKKDRTAWDFVNDCYGSEGAALYRCRVDELFNKGIISKGKHKYLLMPGDKIPEDFINRDLRNTQYIVRKALELFEDFVPGVLATSGAITSRLREDWGLVNVMKEMNLPKYERQGVVETCSDREGHVFKRIQNWTKRNDHRHHAMDALTIAFTKRAYIQYLNHLNARKDVTSQAYAIQQKEMECDGDHRWRFKCPFGDRSRFQREAMRQLDQILVSIKSKNKVLTPSLNRSKKRGGYNRKIEWTPRGPLHKKETVYGRIRRYVTKNVRVGSSFTQAEIEKVANTCFRRALLARLAEFGGDPKKAFTGKNSLEKNPLYCDEAHTQTVPLLVKLVELEEVGTIRKEITPELNVEKVVDRRIRTLLEERLALYGQDAKKAFSNLGENPIWLNQEKGISVKRVTIIDKSDVVSIHEKRDVDGRLMHDEHGRTIPCDYVQTQNNHHVAIFCDAEGNLQEHIETFFDVVERVRQQRIEGRAVEVIDKNYKCDEGWRFLFSMKINEYFVFPDEKTGFDPRSVDLMDPVNYALVSPHLFRVQNLSSKDYYFRHHLETTVENTKALKNVTWKRINTLEKLKNIVKVRVNHIGQIVAVGEY